MSPPVIHASFANPVNSSSPELHVTSRMLMLGRHGWVHETPKTEIELVHAIFARVAFADDLLIALITNSRLDLTFDEFVLCKEQLVPTLALGLELVGTPVLFGFEGLVVAVSACEAPVLAVELGVIQHSLFAASIHVKSEALAFFADADGMVDLPTLVAMD